MGWDELLLLPIDKPHNKACSARIKQKKHHHQQYLRETESVVASKASKPNWKRNTPRKEIQGQSEDTIAPSQSCSDKGLSGLQKVLK